MKTAFLLGSIGSGLILLCHLYSDQSENPVGMLNLHC